MQEVSAKIDAAAAYPYDLEFHHTECSATMGTAVSGRTALTGSWGNAMEGWPDA